MKYDILIFGDSIVFGLNDSNGGWATQLKIYYQKKEFLYKTDYKRIHNMGISGDTSQGLKDRFVTEFVARLNPNKIPVVIIGVGINDLAKSNSDYKYKVNLNQFIQNIFTIITEANKLAPAKIIISSILPVNETITMKPDSRGYTRSNKDVNIYNLALKNLSDENGLKYLDINSKFIVEKHLDIEDGLHPNDEGHRILYNIYKDELDRYLN